MPDSPELLSFIKGAFRSVWSLELLLLLKSDSKRAWTKDELIERLRGSDLIVTQGIDSLVAGGLVVIEANQEVRYMPASDDLRRQADAAEKLYARKPDAVRRIIVLAGDDQLTAFADAFRLRRD